MPVLSCLNFIVCSLWPLNWIMEFRFFCPSCGCKLKADQEVAGININCPECGFEFPVPPPETASSQTEPPATPTRDIAFAKPNPDGELTCPVCWLHFDGGDIMHIAV